MNYIKRLAICCAVCMFSACDNTKIGQDGSITAGFSAKTATFYENAKGSVSFQLSAPAPEDITVRLAVQNENNVQEDKDYILPLKEILILKGRSSAEVEIDFIDDKIVNNSRSFELILTGAQGLAINKEMEKVLITLLDDESDASVVLNAEFSLSENKEEGVIVPLLLEGTPSDDILVTIDVKSVNVTNKAIEGQHFTIEKKEIYIPKGTADLSGLGVKILPKDDSEINPSRVFVLEITKIIGATKITEKSTCVVTIKNDDLGLSWGKTTATVEERPDGKAVLKLPLRLLGDAGRDLHITVAIESDELTENTDYTITSKELVIPAGQDSVEVEIFPVYNNLITPDKLMKVVVAEVEGYDDLAGIGCDVTIYNYDTQLSFGEADYIAPSSWSQISIPLTLSAPVHHDVSVFITGKNTVAGEEDISSMAFVIPAGATSGQQPVLIFPDNGGFSYNFQIAPVSGIQANYCQSTCVLKIAISKELTPLATAEHEKWTIAGFSSDNPGDGGVNSGMAAAAIDGDGATYWHSQYSGAGSTLPQYIVIDLKGEIHLWQITVIKRTSTSNSDTKLAEIYASDNSNGPWNKLGTMNWPENASPDYGRSIDVQNVPARYLKINVTEGFRDFAQIAEVKVMGSYK